MAAYQGGAGGMKRHLLWLRADLRSIELRLTGGDRSLMLIEPLSPLAPAPR